MRQLLAPMLVPYAVTKRGSLLSWWIRALGDAKLGDTARYFADRAHATRNSGRTGASALLVVVQP